MSDGADEAIGDGVLSAQARARLARPAAPPLVPPPMDDLGAVAAWRDEVHRGWLAGDPSPEDCGHRPATIAGVPVLRSASVSDSPMVLYLHGGGAALGSPTVALPITERLAAEGLEVVSVDYRLAPEHPCPAAVEDTMAVLRVLQAETTSRTILLAGDSAGANLALSCAIRCRDATPIPNGGLVLFSPHVDYRSNHRSEADRPSDLDESASSWFADAYRGGLDRADVILSPLWADLRDLPPMLIQVGTIDTSFEQGVRLARRARAVGVDVTLDVWEGLWHTWHYHRDLPEADRALTEAAAWMHRLSPPRP